MNISVKICLTDANAVMPKYATEGDAGMDLYAIDSYTLQPGERRLFKTGICMEIPFGYEGQIRPRSGNALKYGITVLNTPGTVDCGYRGDVGVCLVNLGAEAITINIGDRIAQIVFKEVAYANVIEVISVSDLYASERGLGGFGSSEDFKDYDIKISYIDINSQLVYFTCAEFSENRTFFVPVRSLRDGGVENIEVGYEYVLTMDVSDIGNIKVRAVKNK